MYWWDEKIRKFNLAKHGIDFRNPASDIKRVAARRDTQIVVDDDAPAWTPQMFARAVVKRGLEPSPMKTLLSLRVDSDVVE